MKKYAKMLAVIMLSFWVNISYADEAANALLRKLSQFQTMQAQFRQELFAKNGRLLETYRGQMAMARPNLFLWEIKQPMNQRIIADGHTIWTYDLDLAQVSKVKQVAGKAMTPAELLGGDFKKVLQFFNVSQQGQQFRLTAKNPMVEFREIGFIFDKNKLTALRLVDKLHQTSDVYFENIKFNQPISSNVFRFQPPKGISIVQ